MTDTALAAALSRMTQLERDISAQRNAINDANARLGRLEAERADVAGWIEMWHKLAGTINPPVASERSEINLPVVKPAKRIRPKNPDREDVVEASLEIIQEAGEPMSRKALFDALSDRGFSIQGKDPEMVLSTMLWRSKDKIVRLVPFGYWPAGVPYGPAQELQRSLSEFDDLLGDGAKH